MYPRVIQHSNCIFKVKRTLLFALRSSRTAGHSRFFLSLVVREGLRGGKGPPGGCGSLVSLGSEVLRLSPRDSGLTGNTRIWC